MKQILIPSAEALPEAAQEFLGLMDDATVYAFDGEMGAGKTTFINALSHALGVEDDPTGSPTFSIVNEYRSDTTAELIYHFDLYRIENLEQAFDIGIEDYLDSGALCLIEWPDRIADILPDDTVWVKIDVMPDGSRRLSIGSQEEVANV
ncbi:tRNA (adenosine(37)-N6)-threonylcarbamoyltransferase complex ATPase subunit type 1 TsaE [uncultured Duncaniella sp.]|jgi:tRNA threonylcarbamoyladenosine biosynthesis protein TsaE|uniref:tRNA (adenosine(37)-N6)-threonylcarbamoyltransferase complex ATPase subunit type 1 TsaE n=1 Tax=uncultured Duncaniella sp. TaxID=2768039 RepID=UPI0025B18CEC|nr:tRNA (adenosine(37)-N6)-threonylcarbamoyltransferase complex ATPase subunit type 1 TsaE [uncultured Duncaniella sp.]